MWSKSKIAFQRSTERLIFLCCCCHRRHTLGNNKAWGAKLFLLLVSQATIHNCKPGSLRRWSSFSECGCRLSRIYSWQPYDGTHGFVQKSRRRRNPKLASFPNRKQTYYSIHFGGSRYPALSWLTSSYACGTRDADQKRFNYQLSRARSCIERAFGLTKTLFRILMKKMEFSPKKVQWFLLFVVFCITF